MRSKGFSRHRLDPSHRGEQLIGVIIIAGVAHGTASERGSGKRSIGGSVLAGPGHGGRTRVTLTCWNGHSLNSAYDNFIWVESSTFVASGRRLLSVDTTSLLSAGITPIVSQQVTGTGYLPPAAIDSVTLCWSGADCVNRLRPGGSRRGASRHLLTAVGRSHGSREFVSRLSRKSPISVRPRGSRVDSRSTPQPRQGVRTPRSRSASRDLLTGVPRPFARSEGPEVPRYSSAHLRVRLRRLRFADDGDTANRCSRKRRNPDGPATYRTRDLDEHLVATSLECPSSAVLGTGTPHPRRHPSRAEARGFPRHRTAGLEYCGSRYHLFSWAYSARGFVEQSYRWLCQTAVTPIPCRIRSYRRPHILCRVQVAIRH